MKKKKPTPQKAQSVHQRLKAQREKREAKEAAKAASPAPEKRKPGRPRKDAAAPPANFISKLAAEVNATASTFEAHPLADRFAIMSPARYEALKASIASRHAAGIGALIHPIVIFQGKILNGRHRYRACTELGIEPRFVIFHDDYAAAVEYVIDESTNKDESEGQRAWSAAQFMDDLAKGRTLGRPSENERKSALDSGKSSEQAALRFGISARTIESAVKIKREDADLFAELGAGKLNVHQASNRLKLKQRERDVRKLGAGPLPITDCRLIEDDCIKAMKAEPAESADVVFADPPYNNGWKYNGDPTGDKLTPIEYCDWCGQWMDAAANLLTPAGSLFVLCDDAYTDLLGVELRKTGLHRQPTIIWWETFGADTKTSLTVCTRYIHHYTKSPDWQINPEFRDESARQQQGDVRAHPAGKTPDNVWKVSRKQGTANDRVPFADAPPQLPIEIPQRCILMASSPGARVWDPFNGNGTSAIAALTCGRTYTGSDRSAKYLRQSRQWIASQLAAFEGERKAAS